MTQDILDDVQEEQTSTEETASKETTETKAVEAQPALTKEEVQQMIAEATGRAVTEAKEAGKRELQSAQDRNKAELARMERRATTAEGTLAAARTQAQSIDPEVAKEMELAELRAREQARVAGEQEDRLTQAQEAQVRATRESIDSFLTELKIDLKDPRLNWGNEQDNMVSGRAKLDASVAKILLKEKQTTEGSFEKRLKDLEAKIRGEEQTANSVNTAASTGAVAGSDEDFIKKFASYEIPMSKENIARYNKIQNS